MIDPHILSLASPASAGAAGVRVGGGAPIAGIMRPDGRAFRSNSPGRSPARQQAGTGSSKNPPAFARRRALAARSGIAGRSMEGSGNPMSTLQRTLRRSLGGLWRSPDFMKLWASLTVTAFGSQITNLALPLTAAVMLHATPWQMGVLVALETLPFALVSLHAGVLIDRVRKLPIIIAADIGRGVALLVIPIAAWLRRAVDRDPVCRRLHLRRPERRRRRRVPGAARADRGAAAAGRGQREGDARRDVVGADRPRSRRRSDPADDGAVRDPARRVHVLRLRTDAAPDSRTAGRARIRARTRRSRRRFTRD